MKNFPCCKRQIDLVIYTLAFAIGCTNDSVWEDMKGDECEAEFRFKKGSIYDLVHSFGLPKVHRCHKGLIVDSVEAMCVYETIRIPMQICRPCSKIW